MQTAESAKQFLVNRIIEQAKIDGAGLSEVEKRMFLFSATAPNPDWEANEKFEAGYDDSEYEKKIAKLLRHAYAHDKKVSGQAGLWQEHLEALREEDFYGLVMVDQAHIPRPKVVITISNLVSGLKNIVAPKNILFAFAEGVVALVAIASFLDRVPKPPLLSSDGMRLFVCALCVAAFLGLAKFWATPKRS